MATKSEKDQARARAVEKLRSAVLNVLEAEGRKALDYHDSRARSPEPVLIKNLSRRFRVIFDKRTGGVFSRGVLNCGAATALLSVYGYCILGPPYFVVFAEIAHDGDRWKIYMNCDHSPIRAYNISVGPSGAPGRTDHREAYVSRGPEKPQHLDDTLKPLGMVIEREFHYITDYIKLYEEIRTNKITDKEYVAIIYGHMRQDMDRAIETVLPDATARARVVDVLAPMLLTIACEGWKAELFAQRKPLYKDWKATNRQKDAIDFVKTVYAFHIKLGMTQRDLKEWDPKGYEAFHNRCRYARIEPGSILPSSYEDIDAVVRQHGRAPTYAESVGRAFREASHATKRLTRAYHGLQRRKSEAKSKRRPRKPEPA